MRNFRIFSTALIITFLTGAISFYGAMKVFASEKHKHEDEHEGPDEHADHKGHDHGEDHSDSADAKADEHGDDHHEEGLIRLSPESQELGGIEVQTIETAPFVQKILVNGRIAQDVQNVTHVYSGTSGEVTECFVALGQTVKEGVRLCVLADQGGDGTIEVKAPVSGTILAEFIKPGDHVDGATALYSIADMTRLSANFDIYEKDQGHIQIGQKMNVYPIAYPDQSFLGEIVFVSPRVDEATFTTRIKAVVDNPEQLLKLGMSLRAEIEVVNEASYLRVPSNAIQNVEGKDIVFVQTGAETFEMRNVQVRLKSSGEVAIAGDLAQGDRVVTGGAFILKSKLMESEMEHAHDH